MECKMIVEIYGKEQCPFCDKAKGLAEREGHEYTYMQLGLDFEFPDFMEKFPTARTFPQIIVNGKSFGCDFYETINDVENLVKSETYKEHNEIFAENAAENYVEHIKKL